MKEGPAAAGRIPDKRKEEETGMKRRGLIWLLVLAFCLGTVFPAAAANTFLFSERSVSLYVGDTYRTEIIREGVYGGEAEIRYASSKKSVATVTEDGVITAVGRGETTVTASLIRKGKQVGRAQMTVKVLRAVTKVTLNTTRLSVFDPEDPAVFGLLNEEAENRVLVIPAGTAVNLSATCTPEDATSKKVTYTSTDNGVAKVAGNTLKAVQRGECELTVASAQNPEVTESFHVLVIQPVKKIVIDAGDKNVAAGASKQLTVVFTPENASIRNVTWSSANPAIAEVDADGVVTGRKRGSVNIVATAADGSNAKASVYMNVTQPVTSVSLNQNEYNVVAGRAVQAKATVSPSDASDKKLTWSSSDETIATVKGGQITGKRAGTCTVTVASAASPDVIAEATVNVVQLVSRIECTTPKKEQSLKVGETVDLRWRVLPEDATDSSLTFKSLHPKIATVDANGVVTAVSRGTATIVATARDQGKKSGSVKISVIQPATGVEMQKPLYYIQHGEAGSIRALVQPRNANNQKIHWSSADEYVATVRSNGTSTGSVYGVNNGYTTVTACTDDGGYTADTLIRVGDFNEAVLVEELYVDEDNEIRISLRNMSSDLVLGNIHFVIQCYDIFGNPMLCNQDGESYFFEGDYPFPLEPFSRTRHGNFRFRNYLITAELGAVELTVLSWRDADGVTWTIPEEEQVTAQWVNPDHSELTPIIIHSDDLVQYK